MKIQLEVKVYTKPNFQNMATDGGINVCEAEPTLQAQSINPPIELFLLLSKMQWNPLIWQMILFKPSYFKPLTTA